MNLKKIAAGAVASALAVSALAISASADHLYYPEGTAPALDVNGGNWLYILYNDGEGLGNENPTITDQNFKPWDIAKVSIYGEIVAAEGSEFTLEDYAEDIDGVFSGVIVYSANSGYYGTNSTDSPMYDEENGTTYFNKFNWNVFEYYGLPYEGDTYEGRSTDTGGEGTNLGWCDWTKQMVPVYLKPYNWEFTMEIPDDKRWPSHDDNLDEMAGLYRVGYGAWGDGPAEFNMKINLMVLRGDDGNILFACDYLGNEITAEEAEAKIVELSTPSADDSPANEPSGDSNESGDSSEPAGGDSSDSNGSSGDNASTTTAAPTSSSSSSNDSTPVIIGIIIGVVVVVVIIVAVVVVKKKKS